MSVEEVSFCGLYCPNCGANCRLPQRAAALYDEMKSGQWDEWAPGIEGFTAFWRFLDGLAHPEAPKRCRDESCGDPGCGIRTCAQERGVTACPLCDDYPCDKVRRFAASNPTLLFDGHRMKEIGIEAWSAEQDQRRAGGFYYGCIRCGKDDAPQA